MANRSAPSPVLFGSTTASAAAPATAASAAVPPCCSIFSPAWAASGWLVATMPWRARTSERDRSDHWRSPRSPRAAVMSAEGFGTAALGVPNGVSEWDPDCATLSAAPSASVPKAEKTSARRIRRCVMNSRVALRTRVFTGLPFARRFAD